MSPAGCDLDCGSVGLPERISAVTLVCRDIGRMAAFYRQFGWPEAPTSVAAHVVFQCSNGVVLGLFTETAYERQHGYPSDSFRGFTLTIHCEDERPSTARTRRSGSSTMSLVSTRSRRGLAGDTGLASATLRATSGASLSSTARSSTSRTLHLPLRVPIRTRQPLKENLRVVVFGMKPERSGR